MKSPLTGMPAEKVRDLPRAFLLEQLGSYFHKPAPEAIVTTDYTLWRCAETGLEFCEPAVPGNREFYEWVSSFPSYYPGFRWEYGHVGKLLRDGDTSIESFRVLDVGCGKGDFLRSLEFVTAAKKYALDLNEPAIQACREQGFPAYCGTVETAITGGFLTPGAFPIVTSFHCLEHVGDPVGFVRELLRATASGGRVYVSTPYSPMSFESDWFDVMNHPPHHMARWNLAAYRKLAEILGVRMRHFSPRVRPWAQALQMFRLKKYGPNAGVERAELLKDLLMGWSDVLECLRWTRHRARTAENGGADLILVELIIP